MLVVRFSEDEFKQEAKRLFLSHMWAMNLDFLENYKLPNVSREGIDITAHFMSEMDFYQAESTLRKLVGDNLEAVYEHVFKDGYTEMMKWTYKRVHFNDGKYTLVI